ncbi:MAG: sulfatase [Phycisphaerales bacterium]|nr:sulfatase [Phycisphaerales bacterium]MBT7171912.1 sulfatase [Phycisphaerales bacterium]
MTLAGFGAASAATGLLWAVPKKKKPAKKPAKSKPATGKTPTRPNIVYIIGDDISMDDWGCYGHPSIRTPNVDALAKGGLRCTNAYLSISSCSPSRCSIITGRWPHNTGACELHIDLPKGQVMFPRELKKAGYYTVQAGKWHLGKNAKVAFDNVYEKEERGVGGEGRWIKCLRERPKDKPFFAWFASNDAHRKWQPDEGSEPHTRKDVIVPPYLVDDAATREDLRQYYDEVQRLDRYVGLVVKELKRQGVLDNTIIVVMADNARPFQRCKTRLLDSGIKTPLVISWPKGITTPAVTNSLVSSIDIAPTLLEAAGVKVGPTFQGVSMVPLFADPTATVREYTFGEHNWHDREDHERMVHYKNFTYIRNRRPKGMMTGPADAQASHALSYPSLLKGYKAGTLTKEQMQIFAEVQPAEQLFDSISDPDQFKNLAADPKHAEMLAHLREVLAAWEEQTGDSCPKNLTKDTSERLSGKKFPKGRTGNWRGTMPGSDKNATKINNPGPR